MHHRHTTPAAPETRGATIHWAHAYDSLSLPKLLTLGKIDDVWRMMIDKADLNPGDQVLDVGCGPGNLTRLAKERVGPFGRAAGIDASPEMIEVARQRARQAGLDIEFQIDLIEKMSFPDHSFEAVLSSMMMHHLPDDLKREALLEVKRVLKPGGCLMIVDMKRPESLLGRALLTLMVHRSMPVGVQDLLGYLQEAGFERVEMGDTRVKMLGYILGYTRG